jgi:ABC-type transport system involved in cytochrome c biogenesis permease subunit
MYIIELGFFIASLAILIPTVIIFIIVLIKRRTGFGKPAVKSSGKIEKSAVILQIVSLICLTLSIICRTIATGHGPFSNMYEFTVVFSWGILAVGLFFWQKYRITAVNLASTIIAVILLVIALQLPSRYEELVPALQQSLLLSTHVAVAIVAYAAILYLWQNSRKQHDIASLKVLDDISYQAVKIGFPFMTMTIILGAIWADIAWGSYWSWDPKETASLVTWLLYAAYLHTRFLNQWRGARSAILLVIGFCAVLFTFFGNYIFQGLHSYL